MLHNLFYSVSIIWILWWGIKILIILIIKVFQKMGREEFTTTTNTDGSTRKEHSRTYWFCISPREGMHYRFAKNKAIDFYFCYMPGFAYLGWLLPERTNPYEYFFFVRIPRTIEEARKITDDLSKKPIPVNLSEKELEELIQPDFDITAHMNWIQRWCWKNAQVYVFQNIFFTIHPESKEISFAKVTAGKDGNIPVFVEREECSMNLSAKSFAYGKSVTDQEDASNIPIGIDFTIEGQVENPWYGDVNFNDVFAQIDALIRGEAAIVISKDSFLAKPINVDTITTYLTSFIESAAKGEIPKEKQKLEAQKPEPSSDQRKRLVQSFETAILEILNAPRNYMGFIWDQRVNILDIYPSGENGEAIVNSMIEGAKKQQEAVGKFTELAITTAAGLAENKVRDDDKRKEIDREAYEIEKKSKAEAEAITIIAEANKKNFTILVAAFGADKAIQYLELNAKYAAIGKEGTQVYLGLSSNPEQSLFTQGNKLLTKLNTPKQKKGDQQ